MSRLKTAAGVLLALMIMAIAFAVWALYPQKVDVPALAGALHDGVISVGSRQRSFVYYVPSRPQPDASLLLVLHGSMMDGRRMRGVTAYVFDILAEREGFIVAYPDGYRGHWNDCRAVGDYPAKREGIDDVEFLRALVGWFSREHDVSPDRVFALGVSNGGHMSYRLAWEAPSLVRGIAAIAANLPTVENQTCRPPQSPMATMVINGTEDPVNPHGGGTVALYGVFVRRGQVQSTDATARYWAKLAGHQQDPVREQVADRDPGDGTLTTRLSWSGEAGPDVELLVVQGGGHTIPHPQARLPRLLGRTSRDFSAAEEIWRFFARELRRNAVRGRDSSPAQCRLEEGRGM